MRWGCGEKAVARRGPGYDHCHNDIERRCYFFFFFLAAFFLAAFFFATKPHPLSNTSTAY